MTNKKSPMNKTLSVYKDSNPDILATLQAAASSEEFATLLASKGIKLTPFQNAQIMEIWQSTITGWDNETDTPEVVETATRLYVQELAIPIGLATDEEGTTYYRKPAWRFLFIIACAIAMLDEATGVLNAAYTAGAGVIKTVRFSPQNHITIKVSDFNLYGTAALTIMFEAKHGTRNASQMLQALSEYRDVFYKKHDFICRAGDCPLE